MLIMDRSFSQLLLLLILGGGTILARADDPTLAAIDNGTVKVGIDQAKGGAITWLSWQGSPRKAMACFDSADPRAGPCVHVAPIETVKLAPQATLRYRYWLVVGSKADIAARLDALWAAHADEKLVVE